MAHYGTAPEFETWLTANGLTLPAGADPLVLLTVGSSYVDAAYGARLLCSQRTGGFTQELEWPRTGHYVRGQEVPPDLIPPAWINATYRAAYLQASEAGWATSTADPNRTVKRERVEGAVEIEYFGNKEAVSGNTSAGMPTDAMIDGMVSPWLCSTARRMNDLFRVI